MRRDTRAAAGSVGSLLAPAGASLRATPRSRIGVNLSTGIYITGEGQFKRRERGGRSSPEGTGHHQHLGRRLGGPQRKKFNRGRRRRDSGSLPSMREMWISTGSTPLCGPLRSLCPLR
jgi:hypothetical protein